MSFTQEYQLIDNPSIVKKPPQLKKQKIIKYSLLVLTIVSLGIASFSILKKENEILVEEKIIIKDNEGEKILIKAKPRLDKYGVDLNVNVLDGIYTMGFNNDVEAKVEDWKLYTPPCPYLQPVKHADNDINPVCEKSSLQIANFEKNNGKDLPYVMPLNTISNQLEKWKEWEKKNETILYGNQSVKELVENKYHPFDYGYTGENTENITDKKYYNNVINSRMDEVPDPRRRRLFSFILFNAEYDLLDLYLSEYYDIIDYFVIYESNTTFSGNPKPLYFTRTLLETDRYDKFKDKLIPLPVKIIVDEDNGRGKGFPKEHLARRTVIEKGLRSVHARHGDLFMHGDLDEMPKAHVLSRLKKCGGWEHLQAGIGGGPKSFKNGNVDSYFINPNMNVTVNGKGEYNVDYSRNYSISFLSWFHEYSFNIIQNSKVGTVAHPNLSIFDARRSLGQLNERKNYNKRDSVSSYSDPLLDPNFDIYQGYTYTDNTNDLKKGKGYIGEYLRFDTSKVPELKGKKKATIWNSGWHLSSFLPTIDQFYNKISSYSHFQSYGKKSEETIKKDIINRIKNHQYIYGSKKKYNSVNSTFPLSYENGYEYNFNYDYWNERITSKNNDIGFKKYINDMKREIPTQVWKHPICYSFMIDRDYGIDKKLWWQVIPKEDWKTVKFEELDSEIIDQLVSPNYPESLKKQMLKYLNI
ncbi:hypothetical protein BCR32DRAFT_325391 [Anaeromyces robustus]|uniref:Glycosyltransferase family 17 protein n=1 Tax=Anaeromyces robustus TaxID=1754192 RepID=A0A1Y1XII5_9FUNG|nr:hypothetical protein BCR32DRAFT_325391 [Anaeromyces robustus]|eukprot:ORX85533.1 hypothetical protein BCR32DRAFT_325391 [Anaeromyces robustus]